MHRALWLLLMVLGSGCASIPAGPPNPVLGDSFDVPRTGVLCLAVPPDASDDGEPSVGSGQRIANAIETQLKRDGWQVRQVKAADSKAHCAEKAGTHILVPEVIAFEDNATGWSGRPDRIEIRLTLIPAASASQRTVIYEAASNVAASGALEWGNADPSALLGRSLGESLARLLKDEQ